MTATIDRTEIDTIGDDGLTSPKRQRSKPSPAISGMVCGSSALRDVLEQIRLVAQCRSTVLVTGESGTGKELVARAMHQLSPRSNGPFVALNCAAIPKELAESELFGHCKGAFTGATEPRVGKFTAAHRGTLLIDEIGEMDPPVQAKLLRTLETRLVSPVGSNEEREVDVRVIASTHRDLPALADQGRFREDLYYRLKVVRVHLPPLSDRRDDIPLLVDAFLEQLCSEHGRRVRRVSADAMRALRTYHWPGNVRELRNLLEGIVVLSIKESIELTDLPAEISNMPPAKTGCRRQGMTLGELEREAIQERLNETGGRRQRAARLLGISVRTLIRKIHKYKLQDPRSVAKDSLRPGKAFP